MIFFNDPIFRISFRNIILLQKYNVKIQSIRKFTVSLSMSSQINMKIEWKYWPEYTPHGILFPQVEYNPPCYFLLEFCIGLCNPS